MNKKKLYPILVLGLAVIIYFINDQPNKDQKEKLAIHNSNDMTLDNTIKKTAIGFYNVENLFDIYNDPQTFDDEFTPEGKLAWDIERYTKKLNKIAEVIVSMDNGNPPAILGFAEIENYDVLKDLVHTGDMKKFGYKIIHQNNHDRRGIDVAAIYREDLFQPEEINFYPVTLPGKRQATTRDILHIEGQFSNQEVIHIYYTHWSSRRKGTSETEPKRLSTANILRKKIEEVLDKDDKANIFVLGDFNDEPSNKSLQVLVKNDLYNLSPRLENTSTGTTNHQGNWLVFDQIIISKHLLNDRHFNISKNDVHIYNSEKITFTHRDGNKTPSRTYGGPKYYGGYSDHYPVFVRLNLGN